MNQGKIWQMCYELVWLYMVLAQMHQEQASQLQELQSSMIEILASNHDLNNILQAITLNTGMLRGKGASIFDPEEVEEIIEDAEPVEEPVEVVDTIELPDTDSNKTTANADAPPADFVVDDGVVDGDDEERKKDAT